LFILKRSYAGVFRNQKRQGFDLGEEKEIRFIDLFGGIGGFRLGLERANAGSSELQAQGGGWNKDEKSSSQRDSTSIASEGGENPSEFRGVRSDSEQGVGNTEGRCEPLLEGSGKGIRGELHSVERDKPSQQNRKKRVPSSGGNKIGEVRVQEPAGKFRCVWYCDTDRYATNIYNRNYSEKWSPTDIRKIETKDIPDFDLLCAGFPCQSFSIAGRREGFEDTRGTLFFEICRIASEKKPRLLLLENVKGLLSHDEGRTFARIILSLDELGYDVEWQVLNSRYFGVPQNRERVFIIGHIREERGQPVFPLQEGTGVFSQENGRKQENGQGVCSTIDSRYGSLRNAGETYVLSRPHGFNEGNVKEVPNMRFSSVQNELIYDGHHHQVAKKMGAVTGRENRKGTNWCVIQRFPLKFPTRNQKNIDGDYSFTIDGVNTGGVSDGRTIRRLTPVECERLQAFPDDWTKDGVNSKGEAMTISDTQRYKCLGNAVTCSVVQVIGENILRVLYEQT